MKIVKERKNNEIMQNKGKGEREMRESTETFQLWDRRNKLETIGEMHSRNKETI
jgi:hypothetical protein